MAHTPTSLPCLQNQHPSLQSPPQIGEGIPTNRRNKSVDQFFQQNRFPVPWILVRGSKHTFLSVAL